jgi:molybdopterin-guanine dinucleotide biosynthesis protein A
MTAIILAGGRSSRMGSPKALLPFDDEPLIVHIVRRLQPLFGDIVVVAAPGQDLPSMPVTLVRDDVAYQGPVGGIYYGLQAARKEAAFVTSCDSAFVVPSLISHLLSLSAGCDVVVPRWENRYQPLLAVYRKTVLPCLADQLAKQELRPVFLFDKVRTRVVDEGEIRQFDPDGASFFNMNSPEDYQHALSRWHAGSRGMSGDGSLICTVELFGVARLLTGTREIIVPLVPNATLGHVFDVLLQKLPLLSGRVLTGDGSQLVDGYACNVNGITFLRDLEARVNPGDNIAIMSADAGG